MIILIIAWAALSSFTLIWTLMDLWERASSVERNRAYRFFGKAVAISVLVGFLMTCITILF